MLDTSILIPNTIVGVTNKEEKRIHDLNDVGYGDLITAMEANKPAGKVAFNMVKKTKTVEYPDGNIQVAWKLLKDKYQSKFAPTLTKKSKEFYEARMKHGQDPDIYITYLEDLKVQLEEMGSVMTDDQFMIKIMNTLTDEYDNVVQLLEKRIGAENDPLQIEELREDLNLKFERIKGKEIKREDEYVMVGYGGRKCFQCGKIGHMVRNCNSKGGGGNKAKRQFQKAPNQTGNFQRFTGTCFYCKKPGHRVADCLKKKEKAGQPQTRIDRNG
jgi:hypothetical protein